MTDKESMGPGEELVRQIEQDADDPPLEDDDSFSPSDPSTPPPGLEKRIDVPKLIRAWVVMSDVLKQTVRAVSKNEADNQRTRTASSTTRWAVVVSVVVGLGAGYGYAQENHALLKEIRIQQADMRNQVAKAQADSEITLRVVRKVAEAVGAKLEADTAMHPITDEAARQAAVAAQEEALAAEITVAADPEDRAEAAAKLATVRERARIVRAEAPPINIEDTVLIEGTTASPTGSAEP